MMQMTGEKTNSIDWSADDKKRFFQSVELIRKGLSDGNKWKQMLLQRSVITDIMNTRRSKGVSGAVDSLLAMVSAAEKQLPRQPQKVPASRKVPPKSATVKKR